MDEHEQELQSEDALVVGPQATMTSRSGDDNNQNVISAIIAEPATKPFIAPPTNGHSERRIRINRILMMKRRHEQIGRKPGQRFIHALCILFTIFLLFVSSSVGVAYAYYQAQVPLLNSMAQHSLFQTTHIYDRHGKLLYELYDHGTDRGRRVYVNYDDIAPLLVDATIAAEDHTFWTNAGVDFNGIVRAAVSNVQSHGIVEGGSTVTQQLVKNQFFTDQPRTYQVKLEEAILATGLTQQYPKWKIMEMYLNTVYYGDLNYGVEAAAESYFGLPRCTQTPQTACQPAVSRLDLAQASLLAGLPQRPSDYDPTINKSAALARQKEVLTSMIQLGNITPQEGAQAEQEMANFTFKPYSETHQAPHFVDYVINQVLIPLLGAQNLEDGGYNVYTTLDLDLEKKVEQIVYDHLYKAQQDSYEGYYGPLNITNNVNNAAVVVEDPYNGEILAMDGSAKYDNNNLTVQGQFNAAVALRQPGSSFKPIVYATAFEMGWYPAMILSDHKTTYPNCMADQPSNCYTPQNYDGKFHANFPMTVRNAIANSFNIPAIDAIEYAGIPNVLNMAGRLGLTEVASKPLSDLGPALALGSAEVSLLHLTGAYATFANRGVRVPQTSVLEITDNQGHPLYRFDPDHPQGVSVIREDVAFLMSSILSDKVSRYHEFGSGSPLELDRPAAAKTGTTDSFRDNWTMGYTPHLAAGVWAGNSDNSTMNNVIGITGAGPIWHDVMEYASNLYNYPSDDFIKPANVHVGTVSAFTGLLPRPGELTVSDWFIDGTVPTIVGNDFYTPPAPLKCKDGCKPFCNGDNCKNGGNDIIP